MSNTLNNLTPDLYAALDTVSRELVGFTPAVTLDASVARAAKGQTVRSPIAPAVEATDITPAVTPPDDGDQVIGNNVITISKSRRVPVRWNGEEQRGVNSGPGYRNILQDQFAQAMRTLTNEVESDLASLVINASRAFGTAGVTPFASDLSDTAELRKILVDNGAPISDLQLVIDTSAGAKMRTLTQLSNVSEAGDDSLLRQGILLDVHGMKIRESAQIKQVVKGTGTAYTSDTAGYAIGATVITLITGSGTVVVGDFVTFAGDTNKYGIEVGVSAPGAITLRAPGLRVAIPGSATAMTIGGNFSGNLAFSRSAIVLSTRVPARPEEGDQAEDVLLITDPRSGLTFEVALYKQYRQVSYEISMAWGFAAMKDAHIAALLG